MRVVAAPLVVRQIQSDRRATTYRMTPNAHPTSDFFRPFLLLGGFLEVLASSFLGTSPFVKDFPMHLLARPGL